MCMLNAYMRGAINKIEHIIIKNEKYKNKKKMQNKRIRR